MAKKKYHQSHRDRMHERSGMERHESEGMERHERYSNMIGGRYADNGMIREDRSQPALLPDRIIDKDFPRERDSFKARYDDLYGGVERSMNRDRRELKHIESPDPEFY